MTRSKNSGNLLARVRGGDQRALTSLLVEHLDALEAYVRLRAGALVREKESVSDLVQSVCVEVLRDDDAFEYRGEPQFRAWLFRQALHKIVNKNVFYRRQKRDAAREANAAPGSRTSGADRLSQLYATICSPSKILQQRESEKAFETAFANLEEDHREAITLHRLAGLSHAEIAERMERSEGAVRNLVYRGLARLSSMLEEPATENPDEE